MSDATPARPVVYVDGFTFHWPGHVFPTGKYQALAEELKEHGLVDSFHEPSPATRDQLLTSHRASYLDRLEAIAAGDCAWDPRFECPVTRQVLDAFKLSTGGTILAGRLALKHGFAVNIGGGFHHACPDHGEGFCLLNDAVVGPRVLIAEGLIRRALVVDLDVHQGNGTALMTNDDESIFSLSVHQQNNYPAKERSDLDVGLPDLADDEMYLGAVKQALARAGARFDADLLVYLAGADPYLEDRLGGLAVTIDGLAQRDRLVLDFAEGGGIPLVALLAGGYATDDADVVRIHRNMVEELLRRVCR